MSTILDPHIGQRNIIALDLEDDFDAWWMSLGDLIRRQIRARNRYEEVRQFVRSLDSIVTHFGTGLRPATGQHLDPLQRVGLISPRPQTTYPYCVSCGHHHANHKNNTGACGVCRVCPEFAQKRASEQAP